MIGTDPRGQGGIASVLTVLQRAGFLAWNHVTCVITRACCSKTNFHLHGARFQQFASVQSALLTRWWIGQPLAGSSMLLAFSGNRAAFWIAPQVSSSRGTPALEGAPQRS